MLRGTHFGRARTEPDTFVAATVAAPASERALTGRILAGRYELLELLGAGGMGAVYRAHDRELDELVALKVIKAELARQPAMVDRFRHEVKLARRVTHVNIARTFELGNADGVVYCTMELVQGESLHGRLEREHRLAVVDAAAIAGELCDGLAAAHAAGVIHRDIKPDNVLLANDGRVVLVDFGVAAISTGGSSGELTGTPTYMAPEQARGEPLTPAADVYAVGVLLYEMVTGQRAFTGDLAEILVAKQDLPSLQAPLGSVPYELSRVIERVTARELSARISTAAELRRLLSPWTELSLGPAIARRPSAEPADLLRTVIVLPPSGDDARIHLAAGVHEELLLRLVRRPRLRVLPRADAECVSGAATVELYAGELLSATICRGQVQTALHLPLDIGSVGVAADAIASAVAEVVGSEGTGAADPSAQAYELFLRARILVQRNFTEAQRAIELLEQAHALSPEDARIAASLAILLVRSVMINQNESGYARAHALVESALATASTPAEAYLAAGHLELHTGEPVVAAMHFRSAIACAPHAAEAHEALGRMLIEAGYLDVAVARLNDALAIAPYLITARWEIARAYALEGDWAAYAAQEAELVKHHDHVVARMSIMRMRIAWWRGDQRAVIASHEELGQSSTFFEQTLLPRFRAVVLEGAWAAQREAILELAIGLRSPSLRQRAFMAQLGAELAGYAGDLDACATMIEHAVECGLYDLHWLDRCPLLEAVRQTPRGAAAREHVKARAEAILDALYGDAEAMSDTIAG
ncbi:MAG TPA: protein kinase [Kofleriaceae bacterium]|nr:protein kinase [Kofleriaceae bacterium]